MIMPLDLLTDDANLYSITPYCNGGRLLDRVERKGRFSEPEARHWMRQILKVRREDEEALCIYYLQQYSPSSYSSLYIPQKRRIGPVVSEEGGGGAS